MNKLALVLGVILSMMMARAQNEPDQSTELEAQVKNLTAMGEGFAAGAAMARSSDSAALKQIARDYQEFSENFGSVQSYLQNNQYDDATVTLKRWLARTRNEGVKKALTELLAAIEKEEQIRAKKLAKQVDELFAQAAAELQKAKSPDEVEQIQRSLQDFRNQMRLNSRETRKLSSRLDKANNVLSYWQQVLNSEQRQEWSSALGTLRNLRNSDRETSGLISREMVVGRFQLILENALKDPAAGGKNEELDAVVERALAGLLDGVKTPKDAAAAVRRMELLQSVSSYGPRGERLSVWRNQLATLAQLQELYESGSYGLLLARGGDMATSFPTRGYDRGNLRDERLGNLVTMLQVNALAAVTGWKDLGAARPGESFADFLKATAEKALAAKDWPRLFEVLAYYSAHSGERYGRGGSAQDGVRALIAGQQLEKVGQFRDAARHYTACIAEVGPFVPIEAAAEALTRLRTEHPEAFRPEVEIK